MAPSKHLLASRELVITQIHEAFELATLAATDPTKHNVFKIRAKLIDTLFEKFKEHHIQIVAATGDADLAAQQQIWKMVDAEYIYVLTVADELVSASDVTPRATPTSIDQSAPNVKLPKLELSKFNGEFNQWQSFIDLFNSLIHNRQSISNIEKYHYLILSLEGPPLTVVKAIPLTSAGYQIAYDALIERYSNKRLLATNHWRVLKSYPPLQVEDASSLRRLVDTFNENLSILKTLNFDVDSWDFILVDLLLDKLDGSTRKRFEIHLDASTIPTYAKLKGFLLKQCVALDTMAACKSLPSTSASVKNTKPNVNTHPSQYSRRSFNNFESYSKPVLAHAASLNLSSSPMNNPPSIAISPPCGHDNGNKSKCPLCQQVHIIYRCPTFLALSPQERYSSAKQSRLCINCLRSDHIVNNCSSKSTCRYCNSKHHSLLHFNDKQKPPPSERSDPKTINSCTSISLSSSLKNTTVLLSTVTLEVADRFGIYHKARALVDSGSQASFMVDSYARKLGLPRSRSIVPVFGLGHNPSNASRGIATCHIRPINTTQQPIKIDTIILSQICSNLPSSPLVPEQCEHIQNLTLADPTWNKPGSIDMLLGADIYSSIIRSGIVSAQGTQLVAINTIFGFMLLGPISCSPPSINSFFVSVDLISDSTLKAFWEIEEVPSKNHVSPEDQQAESIFQNTLFRTSSGRFGVSLPFKTNTPTFENSREIADRRLFALERRLSSNPEIKSLYNDFMLDYLSSGHMSLASPTPTGNNTYFIPHHGVIKTDGTSSKIRVVFDASAKALNKLSLNDTLHIGPKLQNNIVTILLRFRVRKVVFTCDVRQMYRQILVTPAHTDFQLIRWRFSPTDPIQTYRLNTITYGVSSSPYLAIRTLIQLAQEGRSQFPLAAEAITSDLYVDDVVSGSHSVETALELQAQLIALFQSGCFELRKWSSNHPVLLQNIPDDHRQSENLSFNGDSDPTIKILGLQWQSASDSFLFKVLPQQSPCTKRSILSNISKIYDPLGFLCPVTFFAKNLIQHLWALGLAWDQTPPKDVCIKWNQYQEELSYLSMLKIPRLLGQGLTLCQLHAFCDASESGYAAVIYFRFIDDHKTDVRFVIAKSKVAPLKRLTIPRLELCAAVLLSNLVAFVLDTYQNIITFEQLFAWSDSTVALSWIRDSPHRRMTFVANRVSHIQDRVSPACWRYIPSCHNPADLPSRGLFPKEFLSTSLWWAGPTWLTEPPDSWPSDPIGLSPPPDVDMEERKIALVVQLNQDDINSLLDRFSSLRKIQGTVAYCFRFISHLKHQDASTGPLSEKELERALLYIVKAVQSEAFPEEINKLHHGSRCPKSLQKLCPFLDSDDILRVGGRLTHADMSFSSKHPILLPRQHRFTQLLILHVHNKFHHPGVNTTIYLLQQNFWVLSARRAVRHYLASCYRCFRTHPAPVFPPMGDLPVDRVSQCKPFSCVGVDFGGPFILKLGNVRGAKTYKGYLCLFVCFATKAIHVELASSLSSEVFIAALRRFVARRGRCSRIFSDCGTNFTGANRELLSYMKFAVESEAIEWRFNPPGAPHFGGLWESGIKSLKTHMARVIGDQVLTYEELYTLVVQIEALLNSRPLCALSTDPNDLGSLTPGHFLTLEPLTAPPDPDLSHLRISRLSRWQLVQHMQQIFWSRWKNEYLHNLYQRGKWAKTHQLEQLDIGTLVLIKDDLAPPLRWRLGRITEVHPGADGVCRVATVQTKHGTVKRPLVKLCPLPTQ